MEYQSFGRSQKPKGANIKQAWKVILVLAVCAWLLYQIKHTKDKTDNYGSQTKPVAGYEAISLGRKGIPSLLDERAFPDSTNIDSVEGKESSGGREDEAEEEFGHINEQFKINEGEKVDLEPTESQPKVSSKNRYKDLSKEKSGEVYIESKRSESDHKGHGNEKYPKRAVIDEIKSNARQDYLVKEKDKDKDEDPKTKEKGNKIQKNVVENATDDGEREEIDEVQIFHDENGIPPDGNATEIVVGLVHITHEENVSSVSKGNWLEKINIYEVASRADNDVEMNLEGPKNPVGNSGIKRDHDVGEGDSVVL